MSSKIVESKNPVIQPLSSILFGPGVGAKYLASMVYCGYTCKKITSKIIHAKKLQLHSTLLVCFLVLLSVHLLSFIHF